MASQGCAILLCCLVLQVSCKPSQETMVTVSSSSSSSVHPTYRISKPETKQPSNRVPPHLQDVRHGFVDDDAGDVIRIIEPPQHFQQLKRQQQQQQQQQHQHQWQQHGQPHFIAHAVGPVKQQRHPPAAAVAREPPQKQRPQRMPLPRPKSAATSDLLTEETRHNVAPPNSLQLPMDILASVRKTERLLQRQRPKLPLMRQRHITRQTHTLISQQALDQQQSQRGQEQRLRAAITKEHKRIKRVKRELSRQPRGDYDVQQGLKLVAHIGELLKNATILLPDELEPNIVEVSAMPLKRKYTVATTKTTTAAAPSALSEVQQQQCGNTTKCSTSSKRLQQQLQRRRQQLFKQGHGTRAPTTVATTAATATRRNFRHEATTNTTTPSAAKIILATSAPALASRLLNARKSPNRSRSNVNHLPQRRIGKAQSGAARKLSASQQAELLYADVMSNIRSLWQAEDMTAAAAEAPPSFIEPRAVANNTDYRALHVYLQELDSIARKLPTVSPNITLHNNGSAVEQSTARLRLNTAEFKRATPTPSWYLINTDGSIFETRLDSETKPTSALFHRFPDIPKDNGPLELYDETMLNVE